MKMRIVMLMAFVTLVSLPTMAKDNDKAKVCDSVSDCHQKIKDVYKAGIADSDKAKTFDKDTRALRQEEQRLMIANVKKFGRGTVKFFKGLGISAWQTSKAAFDSIMKNIPEFKSKRAKNEYLAGIKSGARSSSKRRCSSWAKVKGKYDRFKREDASKDMTFKPHRRGLTDIYTSMLKDFDVKKCKTECGNKFYNLKKVQVCGAITAKEITERKSKKAGQLAACQKSIQDNINALKTTIAGLEAKKLAGNSCQGVSSESSEKDYELKARNLLIEAMGR